MKPTTAFALTAVAALTACQSGPAGNAVTSARAAVTTAPVCALKDTSASTCVKRGAFTAHPVWVCHVWAGTTGGGDPFVFPYTLVVPKQGIGFLPTRVVWHAIDETVKFQSADGPQGLPAGEVSDAGPVDDDEGDGSAVTEARHFRIRWKGTPGSDYAYTIQFTRSSSTRQCDPLIHNSDSN